MNCIEGCFVPEGTDCSTEGVVVMVQRFGSFNFLLQIRYKGVLLILH